MPNPNTAAVANFQNPDAYEQVMGRWSRRLAPLLIQFGGLSDGDRVLDVGCGTGSLTFTLPEIANVASVTGIDLTEPYVEFARARNADPRISFRQADARALPFEDNSFDRAFSMLVLQFIPDAAIGWVARCRIWSRSSVSYMRKTMICICISRASTPPPQREGRCVSDARRLCRVRARHYSRASQGWPRAGAEPGQAARASPGVCGSCRSHP